MVNTEKDNLFSKHCSFSTSILGGQKTCERWVLHTQLLLTSKGQVRGQLPCSPNLSQWCFAAPNPLFAAVRNLSRFVTAPAKWCWDETLNCQHSQRVPNTSVTGQTLQVAVFTQHFGLSPTASRGTVVPISSCPSSLCTGEAVQSCHRDNTLKEAAHCVLMGCVLMDRSRVYSPRSVYKKLKLRSFIEREA
ncbi:hypothetical protein Nmel_014069 [Mimus melanotis]